MSQERAQLVGTEADSTCVRMLFDGEPLQDDIRATFPGQYVDPETNQMGFKVRDLQRWLGSLPTSGIVYPQILDPTQATAHTVSVDESPYKSVMNGRLIVDTNHYSFLVDGEYRHVTPREAQIFKYLFSRLNSYSRFGDIALGVWGFDDHSALSSLRTHIARLRKHLDPVSDHLATKPQFGYGLFEIIPGSTSNSQAGSI